MEEDTNPATGVAPKSGESRKFLDLTIYQWITLIAVCAGTAFFRYLFLGETAPSIDRASFYRWSLSVKIGLIHFFANPSDFLAPVGPGGFAYEIGRLIYVQPYQFYNLTCLLVSTLFPSIGSNGFIGANIESIVTSILSLIGWSFACKSVCARFTDDKHTLSWIVPIFSIVFATSFLHTYFSIQGWHNLASATMAATVAAFYRNKKRPNILKGPLGMKGVLVTILSVYSYFIIPWLLWLSIWIGDTINLKQVSRQAIKRLILFLTLVLLPGIFLYLISPSATAQKAAQIEFSANDAALRLIDWFERSANIMSIPALIVSLALCVGFFNRLRFPMFFLASHILLSTISSRFGGEAWIRTITYVPPLLLVLLMVGAAGQFSRVVKLASGAGLLSFVIHSGLALSDQSFASAKLPGYFEHYHKQQQSVPELIQFVVPLASSNCLVPDDYYTYDTLSIYFRNASLLSRPLGILVLNSENGKLRDYLKRNPAPESCKSGSIFLLLSRETLNSLEYQSLKSWIAIVRGMTASDFELQSKMVFKSTNERQFFALQLDAINNVR